LWGWQIAVFLNIFAVVVGIALLAEPQLRWWRFSIAVLLGIIASYSFAWGLNYWVAAAPLILWRRDGTSRRGAYIAFWVVVAAATVGTYLYGYETPGYLPSPAIALLRPELWLQYALIWLGNPVSAMHGALAGALGAAIVLAAALLLRRHRVVPVSLLLPYLSLAAYATMSAFMTGLGRVGLGLNQATAPRYITVANLLWIPGIVFTYLLARSGLSLRMPQWCGRRRLPVAFPAMVVLALVVGGIIYRSECSLPRYQAEWKARESARAVLASGEADSRAGILHPSLDGLREAVELLRRYRLSVFRDD
jgi:hypothetical protein